MLSVANINMQSSLLAQVWVTHVPAKLPTVRATPYFTLTFVCTHARKQSLSQQENKNSFLLNVARCQPTVSLFQSTSGKKELTHSWIHKNTQISTQRSLYSEHEWANGCHLVTVFQIRQITGADNQTENQLVSISQDLVPTNAADGSM